MAKCRKDDRRNIPGDGTGLESGKLWKETKDRINRNGKRTWRRECHGSSPDGSKRWR